MVNELFLAILKNDINSVAELLEKNRDKSYIPAEGGIGDVKSQRDIGDSKSRHDAGDSKSRHDAGDSKSRHDAGDSKTSLEKISSQHDTAYVNQPLCFDEKMLDELFDTICAFLKHHNIDIKKQPSYFRDFIDLFEELDPKIPMPLLELVSVRVIPVKSNTMITPLMLAAFLGHEEIIRLLIKDSNVEIRNYRGFTAFFCAYLHASATGNLNPLKIFIENGANINQVFFEERLHRYGASRCGKNDYPVDTDYGTLLICAVRENKKWLVQALVELGVDVNQNSILGTTPLSQCLEVVLEKCDTNHCRIKINQHRPEPVLDFEKKESDESEIASLLIERGAVIDKATCWEYDLAGEYGKNLLESTQRRFAQDERFGKDAATRRTIPVRQIVKKYLSNIENEKNMNPVMEMFHSAIRILYLAKHGVDTAFMPSLETLFKENALSLKLRTVDGKTAIHLACENGHLNALLAILRGLRRRKSDSKESYEFLIARDKNGKKAIDLAKLSKQNQEQMVEILCLEIESARENASCSLAMSSYYVSPNLAESCNQDFPVMHLRFRENFKMEWDIRRGMFDLMDKIKKLEGWYRIHEDLIHIMAVQNLTWNRYLDFLSYQEYLADLKYREFKLSMQKSDIKTGNDKGDSKSQSDKGDSKSHSDKGDSKSHSDKGDSKSHSDKGDSKSQSDRGDSKSQRQIKEIKTDLDMAYSIPYILKEHRRAMLLRYWKEFESKIRKEAELQFKNEIISKMTNNRLLWTPVKNMKTLMNKIIRVLADRVLSDYERKMQQLREITVRNRNFEHYLEQIVNNKCEPTLYLFEAFDSNPKLKDHCRKQYDSEEEYTYFHARDIEKDKLNQLCQAIVNSTRIQRLVIGGLNLDQESFFKLLEAIAGNESITTIDMRRMEYHTEQLVLKNLKEISELVDVKRNIQFVIMKPSFKDSCYHVDSTISEKFTVSITQRRRLLTSWTGGQPFEVDPYLADPAPETGIRYLKY